MRHTEKTVNSGIQRNEHPDVKRQQKPVVSSNAMKDPVTMVFPCSVHRFPFVREGEGFSTAQIRVPTKNMCFIAETFIQS